MPVYDVDKDKTLYPRRGTMDGERSGRQGGGGRGGGGLAQVVGYVGKRLKVGQTCARVKGPAPSRSLDRSSLFT